MYLFNPYPAKADCDYSPRCLHDTKVAFQPISSESGLRLGIRSSRPALSAFSTHIQRKRIATINARPMRIGWRTFQPISSESGLRRYVTFASSYSCCFSTHIQRKRIATPKPNFSIADGILFNPYPAKADCDELYYFTGFCSFNFSTHIQRKRIATHPPFSRCYQCRLFNPYPAKADCDRDKKARWGSIESFQPISSESGLRHEFDSPVISFSVSFQPISSESGLRPLLVLLLYQYIWLFNPYPAKADCDLIFPVHIVHAA